MRKEDLVANYFIMLGTSETQDYMTNLRLQKLMYFADAWSLVLRGAPLFPERPVALQYGPVILSVYEKYKPCGKNPITVTDPSFSLSDLSEDDLELLSAVAAKYLPYSTSGLVDMTHKEGGAWKKTAYMDPIRGEDILAEFQNEPRLRLASDKPLPVVDVCPADWING